MSDFRWRNSIESLCNHPLCRSDLRTSDALVSPTAVRSSHMGRWVGLGRAALGWSSHVYDDPGEEQLSCLPHTSTHTSTRMHIHAHTRTHSNGGGRYIGNRCAHPCTRRPVPHHHVPDPFHHRSSPSASLSYSNKEATERASPQRLHIPQYCLPNCQPVPDPVEPSPGCLPIAASLFLLQHLGHDAHSPNWTCLDHTV